MLNLSLDELKQIVKMRRIKNYKNLSKEKLLSALDESESAGSGNNFDNARIKKIKKDFDKLRYGFFKSEIKEIEQNLIELEESILSSISIMIMMTLNTKE